jgi:hypothetical protein
MNTTEKRPTRASYAQKTDQKHHRRDRKLLIPVKLIRKTEADSVPAAYKGVRAVDFSKDTVQSSEATVDKGENEMRDVKETRRRRLSLLSLLLDNMMKLLSVDLPCMSLKRAHGILADGLRVCLVLGVVGGTVASPLSAQELTATRTVDREMAVYFGTWNVFVQGDPNPIGTHTFVELTDFLSDGLRARIQNDPSVDPTVGPSLPSWINVNQTNIEWAIGQNPPPNNLLATANFSASIAALGGSITTDSGFLPDGTRTYLLQSFVTHETAPVIVGDTDSPELFGADGATVTITNNFVAEVSYFERNGNVTLPAIFKCPLSHGYWKNNLSLWAFNSLTLGSQTYTKSELLALLRNLSQQDASIILARQLIAAKLNIGYGSDPSPIAATINASDALIGAVHVPSNVKPSSSKGKAMTAAARTLDNYNNRLLTTICLP